jgi:hypothetical protein
LLDLDYIPSLRAGQKMALPVLVAAVLANLLSLISPRTARRFIAI